MPEKSFSINLDGNLYDIIYRNIIWESDNLESLKKILKFLCKITGTDYSFIFLINNELKSIKIAGYINDGKYVEDIQFPDELNLNLYPWFIQQLKNNSVIKLNLDNQSVPNNRCIIELLNLKSIRNFFATPIFSNSGLKGFIGFASKSLFEKDIDIFLREINFLSLICSKILDNMNLLDKNKYLQKELEVYEKLSNDIIINISKSYKIKDINEKPLIKYLGYNSKELIGFPLLSILHHDDYDKLDTGIKENSDILKSPLEIRIKNKEGYWQQFECRIFEDSEKSLDKIILALSNIKDRKWAELKYKKLFDNSPNAILIIDLKGTIIDANKSTQNVFGHDKQYFINKSLEELDNLFPSKLKNFYKKIFQAYFLQDFPKPIEIQIETKSKLKIWLEVQASIIKQEENILLQLLFQNITEKKKRELLEHEFNQKLKKEVEAQTVDLNFAFDQQKKYLDQILKASQFKTEFMSTMSHELRTPLNAIIGFTELLLEEAYGPLNEDQKDFIKDIKISAEDQFYMIKNILNISKIESGQILLKVKSFSLNNMVDQIISSLKPMIKKKKIEFRFKGLDQERIIEADPIRFKEILVNLLTNAIKFTIEGIITLRVLEKYDKWEFEVSDPGIGIAIKDFPIIFKDFKRVDSTYVRSVPGTGLGLSLTKRLVELHGGEINFFSTLGVGTTFCFSIGKKLDKK